MHTTSLSRRTFLAMAGALPFALRPDSGRAASAFAQTKKIPIGLELYSVRNELMKDIPGTVSAVAKLGYEVVEFYSPYFDWTVDQAKKYRKLLDDLGIKCPSTHNGTNAISGDGLSKAIELNQILGSKYIVLASPGKVATIDDFKALAATLTAAMDKLRPLGMGAGFHNHQMEWRPIDGQRPMDVLAAGTPKDFMLQLDAGTCVEAGADPVAWIKAHPGRIKSMHLKDWAPGTDRGYRVAFGEGTVPWTAMFAAAESTGGAEYYLIEQETAAPGESIAMAQRCLENYKKLRG